MKRSYSLISSSPSSSRLQTTYDVFLSFRGEDTRNGFTSHLFEAFCRKGIFTFLDDDKLEKGKSISPELLKAIESSRCSVIVISENYASSSWCLDELVKILQCMDAYKLIVLPIFYHVNPSHVRKQRGSIRKAFKKHEQSFSHDLEKVQSWRDALQEVVNLAGWHLNDGNEAKLIQEVVAMVSSKLDVANFDIPDDLFGIHSRLEKLNVCVCTSSLDDVQFIGICGLGGIGKTTLARSYYDWMSSHFEGCSFLSNIREVCEKKENGLVYLQNLLLSDILNGLHRKVRDVHEGKNMIRRRLSHKKALVILDDVNRLEQLKVLAEKKDWFGRGSRIIITTRDESLLLSTYKEFRIYRVDEFNYGESIQLFSHKVFKSNEPSKDYGALSKQVIAYAHGLPLALEALGSFLCGRSASQWKSALDRLREYPNKDIMNVLQISFDGLEETEKNIFLDIACFFNGFHKTKIIQIMDACGFYPEIGIKVLIDKSLLHYCEDVKHIRMHDLLREMGMKLVREECHKEPGGRSRIWDYKDFCHVLKYNTGKEEVEAIACCFKEQKKLAFHWESFSNMKKLRLLLLDNLVMETKDCQKKNVEYLCNELRFLDWYKFPSAYLPSSFQPDGLVVLNLISSNIKQLWSAPIEPLHNLRTIDISRSKNFTKFEDFRVAPNLEELILEGCENLKEIHPSITLLERLSILNLKDCICLENLPMEIGGLKSLKVLNLKGCVSLENIPEDLGLLNSLEELYMVGISGREEYLPSSITLLQNLQVLSYSRGGGGGGATIENMTNMIIGKIVLSSTSFSSLTELELISCGLGNGSFPEDVGCFLGSIKRLDLSNNNFTCLPASFNQLSKLEELNLTNCRNLKSLGSELLRDLKRVYLNYCISLDTFVDALDDNCNLIFACFWGCLKLKSRLRASLALPNRFLQNSSINEVYDFSIPGNEIPSWFAHQSYDPFISLQLHPNWCNDKLLGLALFCTYVPPTIKYNCNVILHFLNGSEHGVRLFYVREGTSAVGAFASMDHLSLGFFPLVSIRDIVNYSSQLMYSIQIIDLDGETVTKKYIRSCGVRLVYEQDIEDMDSIFASKPIEYARVG